MGKEQKKHEAWEQWLNDLEAMDVRLKKLTAPGGKQTEKRKVSRGLTHAIEWGADISAEWSRRTNRTGGDQS
jgi:hypothetical protein